MTHPSSEDNELESVKIARRSLEESTTFGWLDSDHFAKILGVDVRFLMFILDGDISKAGGWDVGDGVLGSWDVGDGLAGKDYYRIQAKTGAGGAVLWRTIILNQEITLQGQGDIIGHPIAIIDDNSLP